MQHTSDKSTIQIKWGKSITNLFLAVNGVKQGGVLSPVLFSINMDVLLHPLKESKLGCFIGHIYMGSFGYVDDVILLAHDMSSLQNMLQIANDFSTEYDVLLMPAIFHVLYLIIL